MAFYSRVQKSFETEYKEKSQVLKKRLEQWRTEATVQKIAKPTNLARARTLGYKAKKEFMVVRVCVSKGNRRRRQTDQGRKSGKQRKTMNPGVNLKWFADRKAQNTHKNMKVIGSYFVGEDGRKKWFEVVLKLR
jgi:large subunit ribosomal protein L15e